MTIIIVTNKWWEAAPMVAVFQHLDKRRSDLSAAPNQLFEACHPGPGISTSVSPRLATSCRGVAVEVWCVQDLMDASENSSLTWEKARVLPRVIRDSDSQHLVIAVGTAASPDSRIQNGTVVVGTNVFVHDPYKTPPEPRKHWTHPRLNQIVSSDALPLVEKLSLQFVQEAQKRLLSPPNVPAVPPSILVNSKLVSIGVVNVTSSADYKWTDQQALDKFRSLALEAPASSLETTHGVIRLVLDKPFLFVSGIANAVGQFSGHVGMNPYAQNFVAAHNAAIVVAWIIPELAGSWQ